MRVLRRLFAVGAAICLPAAALGSGCSDKIGNYPGLANEIPAKPNGAVSPSGTTTPSGTGGGDAGGPSALEECTCAIGVQFACTACFENATHDAGLCTADNAACGSGTNCGASYNCVMACGTDAGDAGAVGPCVLGCITSPSVSPDYLTFLGCLCTACENQCPSTVSCATDGGADAADAADG